MPIRHPASTRDERVPGSPADRPDARAGRNMFGANMFGGPSAGSGATVDRRTALRLAGGATAGVLTLGAATGCSDEPVYLPDPLAAQEAAARADAAAASAAIALAPQRQAALNTISAQRTEHADALRTEIDRVIGVYGDGTTPCTAPANRIRPPRGRVRLPPSPAAPYRPPFHPPSSSCVNN